MIRFVPALALVLFAGGGEGRDADWKPAPGPLQTRWARDVNPERPLPDYPRPQLVRKDWLNLNGLWQLAVGSEGEAPPMGITLPKKILVPFPVESSLSGVMKHFERLWYRRLFSVPRAWAGKRVLLHFGAVDWEATVWVNGTRLGSHRGGYDGFTFDVTEALRPGAEQELVVGVWDPNDAGRQPRGKQVTKPGGIFYTPTTGIWQTVWLEPVPEAHLDRLVIVPDVEGSLFRVTALGPGAKSGYTVKAGVGEGIEPVASATGRVGETLELRIPKPKLWSPEQPFLYSLVVELHQGGKVVDSVGSYCGLRSIKVGKDEQGVTRILLNGKFVFQVGPLDQGFWPDGLYTAPTDAALRFDIEVTKKLGFNMTRKHVKVEPERWYYWCDQLGLMVWQDMPSGDASIRPDQPDLIRSPESARQYEQELARMIDGLSNHPSIVTWVVFNEGWGQFDTARVAQWTKKRDPTRLVDSASGWADRKVGDVFDIHVYPGPGSPEPEPHRAAVLGEFGGLGLKVDGHTWSQKTWGYKGTSDRADLTRRYEKLLGGVWRLKEKPGLSAAVYTQLTDVETEANGLLTYDREVIKVDPERAAAVNRGDLSRVPTFTVVVPTSQKKGIPWRYTLKQPADDWFKPSFDDGTWREGRGGFGTAGTPGAVIGTEWKTDHIWIRRTFTLPAASVQDLYLLVHHDEDAEIYLNGVLAARVSGFVTDYEELAISDEARATLKPGTNHLAIHCKQTTGGQYIDAGIISVK